MEKQDLKQKIKETVEKSPYRDDIQKISLFGSYLHGTARPDSDVDLIVEFNPRSRFGLFKYIAINHYFEDQLQRKVDMSTPSALSKYIRSKVLREAEIIYERQ